VKICITGRQPDRMLHTFYLEGTGVSLRQINSPYSKNIDRGESNAHKNQQSSA
jgi:hypothetical protein